MKRIIVWSKQNCPQCEQAKSYLKSKNIEFEERTIGNGWSREQLIEHVPNAKSVPQIFIDDVHIGGYFELTKAI